VSIREEEENLGICVAAVAEAVACHWSLGGGGGGALTPDLEKNLGISMVAVAARYRSLGGGGAWGTCVGSGGEA
jgi:hypothetical protein